MGIFPDPRLDALESAAALCETESIARPAGTPGDARPAGVPRRLGRAAPTTARCSRPTVTTVPDPAKLGALAAGFAASPPRGRRGGRGPRTSPSPGLPASDAVHPGRPGRPRVPPARAGPAADAGPGRRPGLEPARGRLRLTRPRAGPRGPGIPGQRRRFGLGCRPPSSSSPVTCGCTTSRPSTLRARPTRPSRCSSSTTRSSRSRFNRPNRTRFLLESLADLDTSLRDRGGRLVTRRGDWVAEVLAAATAVGADAVHVTDDVTPFARRRLAALERGRRRRGGHACTATRARPSWRPARCPPSAAATSRSSPRTTGAGSRPPAVTVLAPPAAVVVPDRRARRSAAHPRRPGTRRTVTRGPPRWRDRGTTPRSTPGCDPTSPSTATVTTTSRVTRPPGSRAALRFGCVSPAEVERKLRGRPGAEPFVRQLCWRDFYAQVLAARPDAAWGDYRHRGDEWNDDPEHFSAWAEGRTGYPIVDAAMRQLRREGFVHNRARMIAASFLTKDLYLDWRLGARALPGLAGRRRDRQQQPQLAVDRGHRHRHQPAPHLQPHRPGPALRPRRRLRAALRARAAGRRRQGRARALEAPRRGAGRARLPGSDRRPPRGGGRVQGVPGRAQCQARSMTRRVLT